MKTRFARAAALVAATAFTLTGAQALTSNGALADTTVPPWQQPANIDANEVGTLSLYDASGAVVTSGSVADAPIIAYAVGSAELRSGDTKATLYGVLPKSGQAQGAWTSTQLSGSTVYPAVGAPSSISSTLPVFTGSSNDSSIADLVATTPNTDHSSDGYAGLYELRLRTTSAGHPPTTTYDAVDISVSGSSWQVVYPVVAGATTTTLTASPQGAAIHTAVTLTASISPSDAAGTVQFTDGATDIGTSVAVDAGVATTSWTPTTVGDHALKATFTPAQGSPNSSSSGSLTFTATKAKATVVGTWSTAAPVYGKPYTVAATVTAKGLTPTGTVRLLKGTTVLGTATLAKGKAKITVKATSLKPGAYTEVLSYAGNSLTSSAAVTKKIVVHRSASATKIALGAASVTTRSHATVRVTVSATGTTPTGTIYVYKNATGAKIASGKLKKGTVVVTLPLIKTAGTYTIHVKYLGSSLVTTSSSAGSKLKVKKA